MKHLGTNKVGRRAAGGSKVDMAQQRAEPHRLVSPAAITRQGGDSASHGPLENKLLSLSGHQKSIQE